MTSDLRSHNAHINWTHDLCFFVILNIVCIQCWIIIIITKNCWILPNSFINNWILWQEYENMIFIQGIKQNNVYFPKSEVKKKSVNQQALINCSRFE